MANLTNSEDPDEMPHDASFHHGLDRLLKIKLQRNTFFGNTTCDPSMYTMDHPDLIICSFRAFSIKRCQWQF